MLFVLSALAVIPLAGLVGRSTEVLAETVGGSKGALLNATFGNMAELMIAALLILNGEVEVLKASIAGSTLTPTRSPAPQRANAPTRQRADNRRSGRPSKGEGPQLEGRLRTM